MIEYVAYIEWVAVIFYLISVLLTVKKNMWFWPTGIIGVSGFLILFYLTKLYADMALQLVYLIQSIYGWVMWHKEKTKTNEVSIRTISFASGLLLVTGTLLSALLIYWVLVTYTDASLPFWDALAATISLVAMALLALRIFENWLLWIAVDLIYITLFYYKGLYPSSIVYIIFLGLSIAGLLQWKKELKANKVFS